MYVVSRPLLNKGFVCDSERSLLIDCGNRLLEYSIGAKDCEADTEGGLRGGHLAEKRKNQTIMLCPRQGRVKGGQTQTKAVIDQSKEGPPINTSIKEVTFWFNQRTVSHRFNSRGKASICYLV